MIIKNRHFINCLLLAVICAVTYGSFINGPFIYDDEAIISKNPHIRDIRGIGKFFTVRYWNEIHPGTTGVFRPLREVTFAFLYAGFGPNPAAFHSASFIAHIAATILLYFLALRLLKGDDLAALLAGILFAVHPVHVEAVLWAKNIAEIQAALLTMGALLLFLRAIKPDISNKKFIIYTLSSSFLYALVLTCKESGLALPIVILLYIIFAIPRRSMRRALIALAPMAVLAIGYLIFQFSASQLVQAAIEGQRQDPDEALWLRPALVSKTYAFYYRLLLVPVNLCSQYHFVFPVGYTGPEALPYIVGFLALATAVALGLYYKREYAWLILWPILFLGPASNLIPFKGRPIGDQRLYVPSIGLCLLFGLLASIAIKQCLSKTNWRIAIIPISLILTNMLLLAFTRGPIWVNSDRFWFDMFRKSPIQAEANYQVGQIYWDKGRALEALEHADRCIEGNPLHFQGFILQGKSYGMLGDHKAAIESFSNALTIAPMLPEAYFNMGIAYLILGNPDMAIESFRRSLELFPDDPQTRTDLANAYREAGRLDEARDMIQTAIRLDSRNPRAHFSRGLIEMEAGNPPSAMEAFEQALQIEPNHPLYLTNAAAAALALNRPDIAHGLIQRALRQAPGYPPAVELLNRMSQ